MEGNARAGAAAQWRRRYEGRTVTWREEHARRYVDDGLAVFDPDGPYPGVDGSRYHPGVLDEDKGFPQLPVLLITSRGSAELVAGWDSYQQMRAWVASRGTTGSGDLAAPPVVRSARSALEEAVLAYALGRPSDLPAIAAYLSADTFTSDVRYDIYAAMLDLAHAGATAYPDRVAAALDERAAHVPARHRHEHYGGPGLPWAHAYLRRLDQTQVDLGTARSAAASLRSEDRQAASRRTAMLQAAAGRARGRVVLPGPRRAVRPPQVAAPSVRAAPPSPGLPGPCVSRRAGG
jgi:hypothetical protein